VNRTFAEYKTRYQNVRMTRSHGILTVELHTGGGSLVWGDGPHTELGYCFADIAADIENRVVILTGAGEAFCNQLDDSWVGTMTPTKWQKIFYHGQRLLENLLAIEVPVIGVVNGPATVHAEIIALSDIVIGTPTAILRDAPHFRHGTVPSDGTHAVWQKLLGANRARAFLLLSETIQPEEAMRLGVYHSVADDVASARDRARQFAATIASKPPTVVRYTRWALTQSLRRELVADLGVGLALEGLGAFESWPAGPQKFSVR
jgi:enoyl-CoA hydratase/carnithine racemase